MPELTRSQQAFNKAPPDIQSLTKLFLKDEREVQHQKHRVLPGTGEGIHQALLRHIKEAVK
jgi:hypothetical protein